MTRRRHQSKVLLVLSFALALSACRSELYHGLDERSANEMIVALEQTGIDAAKTRDDKDPKLWTVTVPDGANVDAMHALELRGLPHPKVDGFSKFYPSDGLVPTANEERVLLQYATSQELRRTLLAIDGVLDAHVNLVLPQDDRRLIDSKPRPARASVLVKYVAAAEPPVTATQVKTIVAGGVDGLEPDAVRVVLTPSKAASKPIGSLKLVQVGPLTVAPRAQNVARAVFGLLTSIIAGLAIALIVVVVRRRRT